MVTIRIEHDGDIAAREVLLDGVWGATRLEKTAERLREDRDPADGLSFVATEDERIVGTLRLWHVCAGPGRPALLLGPLAVDQARRGRGIGGKLMQRGLAAARRRGHHAVLLIGDAPYYQRFGFAAVNTAALWLPGPFARDRLLGYELTPGALDGARGMISATGRRISRPSLESLIAGLDPVAARRAA